MYLPIIGSFLEAAGIILEKRVLRNKKIDYRNYTVFGFLAISLMSLPFLIWLWRIDGGFWNAKPVLIFAFVILASLIANLLTYYSIKRKKIAEYEPLWLMQPLFTVLLAVILYPGERNWMIVLLALVASFSLILMHWNGKHLNFDKYMWAGLLGSLFYAVELVASKSILAYFSPFTFYFIRCFFIFIFALLIFRPNVKIVNRKIGLNILLIGLIWVIYRAILYYGYGTYGIIYTTILFILAPVLMLLFARLFLKEKMTRRQIITNVIILICVVLAIVIEKA